jgi:undecaprenyl diphosphate synthase
MTTEQASALTHLAIIMDGNGRWATRHMRPRAFGHSRGAETLRNLLKPTAELGIKYLSVYAFSHENWQRSQEEVQDLMQLLKLYLNREITTLINNNIRLRISGDVSRFDEKTQRQLDDALERTKGGTSLTLNICLSYGARQEILHACKQLIAKGADAETLTTEDIRAHLYCPDIPDPDLLIRTGGDSRISNFLLWQSAYTELYFTDILWPDFTPEALRTAYDAYQLRERRYGKRP